MGEGKVLDENIYLDLETFEGFRIYTLQITTLLPKWVYKEHTST